MNRPAPQFRQVAATPLDVSDEEIMKLSDDLDIPVLVRPEKKSEPPAPAIPAESQKPAVEKISAPAAPTLAATPRKRMTRQKTAPAVDPVSDDMRRVSINVPAALAEELRRRAFEERASARHFMLWALRRIGFNVPDSELVPDARLREYQNRD